MIPEPRADDRNEIEIDSRAEVSSPPTPLDSLLLSQAERAEDLVITGTAVLTFQYTSYKSRSGDDKNFVLLWRSALLLHSSIQVAPLKLSASVQPFPIYQPCLITVPMSLLSDFARGAALGGGTGSTRTTSPTGSHTGAYTKPNQWHKEYTQKRVKQLRRKKRRALFVYYGYIESGRPSPIAP